MKEIATSIAALILMMSLCAVATAQSSQRSTPAVASPVASNTVDGNTSEKELTPDQTIALLIADLKELREVHELTKAERDEAVSALENEKKYSASLGRSYSSAEKQIADLNRSLSHLERAIALHEKTIAMVEKQRDDAKRDAKRSRKLAVLALIITAARFAF